MQSIGGGGGGASRTFLLKKHSGLYTSIATCYLPHNLCIKYGGQPASQRAAVVFVGVARSTYEQPPECVFEVMFCIL